MCPGYTPLHMAVGYSHMPVAAALLEAGADPEVWPLHVSRVWVFLQDS